MVATETVRADLERRGFRNVRAWSRGVDTGLFNPDYDHPAPELESPVLLYAGRVAPEKNLEAFLDLKMPGKKVDTLPILYGFTGW